MAQAMQAYTESVLSEEQKIHLRRLPLSAQMEVDGRRFFLCHAVPSDPLFKYGSAEPAFWTPEATAVSAGTILVGYAHLPFVLDLGAKRVVNPGSVGQPKHGAPEACYAVCENGSIKLKSCRYPVAETVRKVLALPIEMRIRTELAGVLETGATLG
jgi:protein phosphatase